MDETQSRLQSVTNTLVNELIRLTPESMSNIKFEIIATSDGGADYELLENHPDVQYVQLSQNISDAVSTYIPLVKAYIPQWRRSEITLQQKIGEKWDVTVDFEHEKHL